MWIIDFCARRSSDCVEQAEACGDAERRQAWLHLASEWAQVADRVVLPNRGKGTPVGEAVETEPQATVAA